MAGRTTNPKNWYQQALIVFHHHNLERDQALLLDRNWKQVDYYELSCRSELWGAAFMLSLDKAVTHSPDEAMIYCLERLSIEGENWGEESVSDIHIIDFGTFILSSGYLAQTESREISIAHFLENFNEIKDGIFKTEGSSLHKNGREIPKDLPLAEEELVAVVCFSDRWNDRQYFIESRKEWILFTWCTSV